MLHVMDKNPSTYVSNNDSWVKSLGNQILHLYFSKLKSEAFLGDSPSGSFGGTYAFTSGNPYTALHNASYTVTYRLNSDGNYGVYVKISDVFDFAWGKYGSRVWE